MKKLYGGKRDGAGRPKGLGPYGEATKPIRVPLSRLEDVKRLIANQPCKLPFYSSRVEAGFPSPADDHAEQKLDLNEHLIKHPAATFFVKASGFSMINAGINPNDILVVDRSIEPTHGKIVIAALDGELTVKRLSKKKDKVLLVPENYDFQPIDITNKENVIIWGVVISVIHVL